MLPRKYFVVKGKGLSRTSPLVAFNNALRDAGIHHLNLVPVSSILPSDASEESYRELPPGSIAFVVLSETRVKGPAKISAGISWARGVPHGYVLEHHNSSSAADTLRELEKMWREIVESESVLLEAPRYLVDELEVPEGHYGSVLAALVFTELAALQL
ncbi:MAG: pyruvoyl-dependent arginine decarboxylase [Thermofilum sp.]